MTNPTTYSPLSPWPHRFALLTVIATFPLLFVGGLVTSLGAGLAVPDWPTTFGYNMFAYPWSRMVGGIFYEHSHRLFGSAVGLLTILLAVSLWWWESRPWLRKLGLVALGAVILQGTLGGLRVVLLQQTLAIVHACFAQAFFALAASIALFTSEEWCGQPVKYGSPDTESIRRLGLLTMGFLYLQLILGAIVRHRGELVELHMLGAAVAAVHIFLLASRAGRVQAAVPRLARSAALLRGLLLAQLSLGFGAYFAKFTAAGMFLNPYLVPLATSHVVIGALMFVTSVRLTLRAFRFLGLPSPVLDAPLVSGNVSV
ncbi:MAG: COX15/CtaA family protein [Deltaproteobacteria bacterium]|nr:COX15/CtaA family protein [Deltaproteobacteria bacterium]